MFVYIPDRLSAVKGLAQGCGDFLECYRASTQPEELSVPNTLQAGWLVEADPTNLRSCKTISLRHSLTGVQVEIPVFHFLKLLSVAGEGGIESLPLLVGFTPTALLLLSQKMQDELSSSKRHRIWRDVDVVPAEALKEGDVVEGFSLFCVEYSVNYRPFTSQWVYMGSSGLGLNDRSETELAGLSSKYKLSHIFLKRVKGHLAYSDATLALPVEDLATTLLFRSDSVLVHPLVSYTALKSVAESVDSNPLLSQKWTMLWNRYWHYHTNHHPGTTPVLGTVAAAWAEPANARWPSPGIPYNATPQFMEMLKTLQATVKKEFVPELVSQDGALLYLTATQKDSPLSWDKVVSALEADNEFVFKLPASEAQLVLYSKYESIDMLCIIIQKQAKGQYSCFIQTPEIRTNSLYTRIQPHRALLLNSLEELKAAYHNKLSNYGLILRPSL